MTNRKIVATGLSVAAAIALIATFFIGCEDEPPSASDTDQYFSSIPYTPADRPPGELALHLSPATKTIATIQEQVAFRANGGEGPYFWSVGNSERGTIRPSAINSDAAVYTVAKVAPNTILVTDVTGRSAIAEINISGGNVLTIIPETVTFFLPQAGDTVNLTVNGGVPPYGPWQVSFAEMGTLTVNSGGATYTVASSTIIGTNTIAVADASGDIAEAVMIHTDKATKLKIIPSQVELGEDGQEAWFIATGGVPNYEWAITYPNRGTILSVSPDTRTMAYRRDSAGDQIVVVRDSRGVTAEQTIKQEEPTPPKVSPASATVNSNQTAAVVFTVTGGTPDYVWSLQPTGVGALATTVGSQTLFTRTATDPASNSIVRVTDSTGQSGFATVNVQ